MQCLPLLTQTSNGIKLSMCLHFFWLPILLEIHTAKHKVNLKISFKNIDFYAFASGFFSKPRSLRIKEIPGGIFTGNLAEIPKSFKKFQLSGTGYNFF